MKESSIDKCQNQKYVEVVSLKFLNRVIEKSKIKNIRGSF